MNNLAADPGYRDPRCVFEMRVSTVDGGGHGWTTHVFQCRCGRPEYVPPVVTPVGNVNDLLAEVCAGGECDPD